MSRSWARARSRLWAGLARREVAIAVEVVGEEAHRVLERHERSRERERADLGRVEQSARARDEARRERLEERAVDPHAREVALVLGRGAGSRARELAEVEHHRPWHHGVEVDHAQSIAGARRRAAGC